MGGTVDACDHDYDFVKDLWFGLHGASTFGVRQLHSVGAGDALCAPCTGGVQTSALRFAGQDEDYRAISTGASGYSRVDIAGTHVRLDAVPRARS